MAGALEPGLWEIEPRAGAKREQLDDKHNDDMPSGRTGRVDGDDNNQTLVGDDEMLTMRMK